MSDNNGNDYVEPEQLAEVRAYTAKECQQLLNHQSFQDAAAATERRIIADWKRAQNPLEREMAWHKLQAFTALRSELRAYANRRPLTIP